MSSDAIVIKVDNLSKCYPIYEKPSDRLRQSLYSRLQRLFGRPSKKYYREFWALNNLSIEVKKGETVGIIGPNGSGKSTLLQLICGTIAPTSGDVITHGRVAALLELGSGFNPEFNGRENVYMNAALLGLSNAEIDRRFDEIAAFADIGDFMDQPVKIYSSGMAVRLAFAVSVCVEPNILLIDEALSVGDTAFQFKCLDRLKRITANGTTLLFVSHDIGMVKAFCERAIYLRQGELRDQGKPENVIERYMSELAIERHRTLQGRAVGFKPSFSPDRPAVGTDEGSIRAAYFVSTKNSMATFIRGNGIEVQIDAVYASTVKQPVIKLLIQDRRLLLLGGDLFGIEGVGQELKTASLKVIFQARLAAGLYFISVILENRLSDKLAYPIDKQVGLLSFEIIEKGSPLIGMVDMGLISQRALRVVALLAVRNEALYMERCLQHLHEQGIETCVIDNESTDSTLEIARKFLGRGVFRIETKRYEGFFDLAGILRLKESLAQTIPADWFIHCDADEIRQAPNCFQSLYEGIVTVDREGYNAINFDEFVFVPTVENTQFEHADYVKAMRSYYFFEPSPLRRVNAWKNYGQVVDLVSSGGHAVQFEDRRIYPEPFILRHYIILSRKHALQKYGHERIYSQVEVKESGWHNNRVDIDLSQFQLPRSSQLKMLCEKELLDKSEPIGHHAIFQKI